ncbi:ABC transporter transmembrane domain-containing protein [Methylobacillus rhizosphaerae]|uniref:ABC transporter transmembrane domain-containing protein n=1 Tax=Methylobacillus rhizosphaerae TaxID=551994 RepID=UPI002481E461|nr:ABC transporter transmembrane domain-containing protein [Methylobacillus rhizosphaerae]
MHPLKRLFTHARQYKRDAWVASFYSLLNKIFDVLPEILIGVAVDVVVNQKDSFLAGLGVVEPRDQLILLAILTVIIWVGESLFQYLYDVRWRNLAQNLQHELRMQAYQHVQKLELAYFERNRSGNLLAILNEDINQMERFFNGGFNSLVQVFFGTLMVGGVFFFLTKELAFLALIPVPFILYGAFWFQSRLAALHIGEGVFWRIGCKIKQ